MPVSWDWLFRMPLHLDALPGLTWAVIFWLVFALIGVYFAFANAAAALGTWHDPESNAQGIRWYVVTGLASAMLAIGFLGAALLAGWLAAMQPSVPNQPPRGARSALTIVLLESLLFVTAVKEYLAWLGRRLAAHDVKPRGRT